jgi:hypothetical protein
VHVGGGGVRVSVCELSTMCKVDVTVREHINKGRRKCVCELSTICKVAAVDI